METSDSAMYKNAKTLNREKRWRNYRSSKKLLLKSGIEFDEKPNGQFSIPDGKITWNFWATTGKFYCPNTGEKGRGIFELFRVLKLQKKEKQETLKLELKDSVWELFGPMVKGAVNFLQNLFPKKEKQKMNYRKVYKNYFDIVLDEFVPCGVCGKTAVDIHHIKFRSQGGKDNIENLIALCRVCHNLAHNGHTKKETLFALQKRAMLKGRK